MDEARPGRVIVTPVGTPLSGRRLTGRRPPNPPPAEAEGVDKDEGVAGGRVPGVRVDPVIDVDDVPVRGRLGVVVVVVAWEEEEGIPRRDLAAELGVGAGLRLGVLGTLEAFVVVLGTCNVCW